MVDRKPRVAVTLNDDTRELMMRLAEIEGTSASRVVASIVEAFAPTARQIIDAAEALQQFPEAQRRDIAAAFESMAPDVQEKLGAAQEAFSAALNVAGGTK